LSMTVTDVIESGENPLLGFVGWRDDDTSSCDDHCWH